MRQIVRKREARSEIDGTRWDQMTRGSNFFLSPFISRGTLGSRRRGDAPESDALDADVFRGSSLR